MKISKITNLTRSLNGTLPLPAGAVTLAAIGGAGYVCLMPSGRWVEWMGGAMKSGSKRWRRLKGEGERKKQNFTTQYMLQKQSGHSVITNEQSINRPPEGHPEELVLLYIEKYKLFQISKTRLGV